MVESGGIAWIGQLKEFGTQACVADGEVGWSTGGAQYLARELDGFGRCDVEQGFGGRTGAQSDAGGAGGFGGNDEGETVRLPGVVAG